MSQNKTRFKFRIFDKINREYMVPFQDGNLFLYKNTNGQSIYLDFAINNPAFFVVQQWAGIYDKNGIEIFEGDLVNFTTKGFAHEVYPEDWTDMLVAWDDEDAGFFFEKEVEVDGKKTLCKLFMLDGIYKNTLVIVGNQLTKYL